MNRTWENSTHYITYSHCIGSSCRHYRVRCHILKAMPDGLRLKVQTFGNLWKGSEQVTRVRYIESFRVNAL